MWKEWWAVVRKTGWLVAAYVLFVTGMLWAAVPNAMITVHVGVHGPAPPAEVHIVAWSGDRTVQSTARRTSHGPLEARFELRANATWEVHAEAKGWWGPSSTVVAGHQTEATVELWPTGSIEGKAVRTDRGGKPLEVFVRLWNSPGAPSGQPPLEEERFPCDLHKTVLTCTVPAGTWDLAVRARGHVSQFRWGVRVPAGSTLRLGTLRFVPGAFVIGWLRSEVAGVKLERCTVRLLPYRSGPLDAANTDRVRHRGVTVRPNGRGFFQLTGVQPGRYVLRAEGPGCAPVQAGPFDVVAGSESELREPLILQEPASLLVAVEPPADPEGRPWIVELQRSSTTESSRLEAATRDPASPAGDWKTTGLAPGSYIVLVRDRDAAIWASQGVEVAPGDNNTFITLDTVDICGTLSLGDTPIAGHLVFHEVWKKNLASSLARITVEAGTDGTFQGVLPHPGRWTATVTAPAARVTRRVGPLDVVRRQGLCARVDIELPDQSISGTVVDGENQPVADARVKMAVLVEGQQGAVDTKTGDDGTFVFRGMEAGRYMVSATDGLRRSRSEPVELRKGGDVTGLRLVLEDTRHVTGVVLGTAGPVPGATVMAVAPGQAMASPVTTGADGGFELDVREPAAVATLMVAPPGYCAQLSRLGSVLQGDRAVIRVGQACGGIAVDGLVGNIHGALLVSGDGAAFPIDFFVMWDHMNGVSFQEGNRVRLAHLAPGRYRVCA
ncbi:MAG: carboxypeptidase regulatory-like domain-containing protein, partial [Acidobacteria bacterium]|nr:carboxypeptidase regulatory-like domain-containing protein [Acidobacteriota bacterium]